MEIQKEKIKQEFWNWAKVENPRVVEDAELGDVYAIQTLDHMFMGFAAAKAQAVPEGFVLVEKKEFEQMQEFEDLYRRAIFNSKKSIHEVNWSHVSNLGVGSTRAKAMCKRFNIDPEATFRKPQEPTND
ncbi:hypothetical protein [Acinetobacter johnsonii]|uniref:hypothetical protein n=1 Tax=Acinetobacter johnsonii TaxID=40214 RepID=UPI001D0E8FD6|nr:hypothetical protein [Acinetobacter johnsonii]